MNTDRVTRHSSVNLVLALFKGWVYASIAYPVSIRLSSGVNDFVHCALMHANGASNQGDWLRFYDVKTDVNNGCLPSGGIGF
jgi:hypothetical protein